MVHVWVSSDVCMYVCIIADLLGEESNHSV